MYKVNIIIFVIPAVLAVSSFSAERKVTLTTYYPAPFGSYERIQAGKGVQPVATGDIALQRQLSVGKNVQPASGFMGQISVNIATNTISTGYNFDIGNSSYVYYNGDVFFNGMPGWVANEGLLLDIAVGGHTLVSGQGMSAQAGYVYISTWNGANNQGGEITLRGTGANEVNWSFDVYNNEFRLRSSVNKPFAALSEGATDQLIVDADGNLYAGKIYDDSGINKIKGGTLFIGTGALIRASTGSSSGNNLWNGDPTAFDPGIYSVEPKIAMNFVTTDQDFKWFSDGVNGVNPPGMILNKDDGLTIEDGLWIKGYDSSETYGLKVSSDTWFGKRVGIGGRPDNDYALKIFDGAGNRDALLGDDFVVEGKAAIGFNESEPFLTITPQNQSTSLNVLKDVEVGTFDISKRRPVIRGKGSITASDDIISINGDFYSKNGALVKYETGSSFNPVYAGIYSNDNNQLSGVMNFVTNKQGFKWYGEGYNDSGVILPDSYLMSLSSNPADGLTIANNTLLGAGLHITKSDSNTVIGSIKANSAPTKSLDVSILDSPGLSPVLKMKYTPDTNPADGVDDSIHIVNIGNVNGPEVPLPNEEHVYTTGRQRVKVYGQLLISTGALSDNTITSADILNTTITSTEIVYDTSTVIFPDHVDPVTSPADHFKKYGNHVEIQSSAPGLNANFIDGYDSQDLFDMFSRNVDTCARPLSGSKHNNDEINNAVKNCVRSIKDKDLTVKWNCKYIVDTYPRGGRGLLVVCKKKSLNDPTPEDIIPDYTRSFTTYVYGVYNPIDGLGPETREFDLAGSEIALETIGAGNIKDNSIKADDLGTDSVNSSNIINGDDGVRSTDIQNNSITLADMAINSVDSTKIENGQVKSVDILDNTILGDFTGSGLPSDIGDGGGDIDQDTITAWNMAPDGIKQADLALELIDSDKIKNNRITSADIRDSTIQGDFTGSGLPGDIGDGGGDIADKTITSWNIQSGSIGADDLGPNVIDEGKIANNTITGADIQDGSILPANINMTDFTASLDWPNLDFVRSLNILDGTISNDDLADGSVDSSKIINGEVTLDKLTTDSVDSSKIKNTSILGANDPFGGDIFGDTITGWNIQEVSIYGGVDSGDIARDAITGTHIKGGTIGILDLGTDSVDGNKIIGSTITTTDILNDTILADDINLNNLHVVSGGLPLPSNINSSNIVDGTIDSVDIKDLTIQGIDIDGGTITGWNIKNLSIGLDDLAANSVDVAELAPNSVELADLATNAVDSSAKIINDSITQIDFAASLLTGGSDSIMWKTDLDSNGKIDRANEAQTASSVEICIGGTCYKCKVKKMPLTYLTGLTTTGPGDISGIQTDSASDTFEDWDTNYTGNTQTKDALIIDDPDLLNADPCS